MNDIARELAERFGRLPDVAAVAMGGSHATRAADARSDVDLYVYSDAEIPVAFRLDLARSRSGRFEVDNRFWETGDEWEDAQAGVFVDVMYRRRAWIEGALSDLFEHFRAGIGYSTCLWHNVMTSEALFDRNGWFAELQRRARRPYPDRLAASIVAKNLPLLDDRISCFAAQIAKAAERDDRVAVNHRVAAFLASYFDVLFAINRTPHPGEKRLLAHASRLADLPADWKRDVDRLLALASDGSSRQLVEATAALSRGIRRLAGEAPPASARD